MEQATSYLYMFLALLVSLLLIKLKKRRGNGDVRLPPGPWRLPIIGSLHHVAGNPLVHRALADLACRLDAPLMYLKLGEVPVVVATSPEAAREVMKTHDDTFATRPWSPTIKIMMSGEPVNVSERIDVLITDSAVRAMIGDRFKKREEFLEVLREGSKLVAGFSLGDLFPSLPFVSSITGSARMARENHRKCFELMDYAIRQHEERRAAAAANGAVEEDGDLVGVLLRIQKEGGLDVPLTMGIIKALILDLFSAGSETSATTLQWAMSELMRYPRVMRKAQAELRSHLHGKQNINEDDLVDLKYLRLIIKETLRLHPPAPLLLPRQAREPSKVLGYDVPKGTIVLVNAWAIGRDPKHWDDAEEFRPELFDSSTADSKVMDFEYIPFGAGRRICPGMAFAQSNIELALAALLYHFDWEFSTGAKPEKLDMVEEMGLAVRRKNDLYLHAIVRVPQHAVP